MHCNDAFVKENINVKKKIHLGSPSQYLGKRKIKII
jgi:hypothetical protein